MFIKTQILSL